MNVTLKYFTGNDQRYLPRWNIKLPAHYKLADQNAIKTGFIKDISASGICLETQTSPSFSSKIEVIIFLSDNKYVRADGIVVWIEALDKHYEIGVDFINLTQTAQETILNHAFELNHKEISRNWFKGWPSSEEEI